MRLISLFALLLCSLASQAATPLQDSLELIGIQQLCLQTGALAQQGMPAEQQARLAKAFDGERLCHDLQQRLAKRLSREQQEQAQVLLGGELARFFSEAERSAASDPQLAAYRQRLAEQPPLGARIELIQQLDATAHTSALASLLRYEIGKSQAWLTVHSRGESIDEQQLASATVEQQQRLQQASQQAVQGFMLYAYRRMPSEQLQSYLDLYRQPPLQALLQASQEELLQLFRERRSELLH
ncbi:hypothetical protein [Pseudomonas fluvialis]|uniref:hypothetical protein n=1 Tax=Pseudomonas fluvialis TaxID=1793966 RepID=UPI0035B2602C